MVFQADIAFALGLIALGLGGLLIMKTAKEGGNSCRAVSKIIGILVVLGATATLICTGINSIKYYKEKPMMKGRGVMPMMPHGQMMRPGMMPPQTKTPQPAPAPEKK